MDVFSLMPIEAFMDDRLTKTDLRVLGAILSFHNKKTNLCWPKREQISERCNLSVCKISTSTSHLVELGWLKKEGDGGRSKSSNYTLIIPALLAKTVPDLGTVTESGTVPDLGTKTVPDLGTGIKQTNEQTITTTTSARAKKSKSVTKPKAVINRDWQPGDRCMELITRAGISKEFAYGLIDEFVLYWEERGDKRSGWEATFVNHAKLQWDRTKKSRLDPRRSETGFPHNVRGNYATYQPTSQPDRPGYKDGRKLSNCERVQQGLERFEARIERERREAERIINPESENNYPYLVSDVGLVRA